MVPITGIVVGRSLDKTIGHLPCGNMELALFIKIFQKSIVVTFLLQDPCYRVTVIEYLVVIGPTAVASWFDVVNIGW